MRRAHFVSLAGGKGGRPGTVLQAASARRSPMSMPPAAEVTAAFGPLLGPLNAVRNGSFASAFCIRSAKNRERPGPPSGCSDKGPTDPRPGTNPVVLSHVRDCRDRACSPPWGVKAPLGVPRPKFVREHLVGREQHPLKSRRRLEFLFKIIHLSTFTFDVQIHFREPKFQASVKSS